MGAVLDSRHAHEHHLGRHHAHGQRQLHFLDDAFQLGQMAEEVVLPVSVAFQLVAVA